MAIHVLMIKTTVKYSILYRKLSWALSILFRLKGCPEGFTYNKRGKFELISWSTTINLIILYDYKVVMPALLNFTLEDVIFKVLKHFPSWKCY